ncbi:MAG: hypothetical protein M5R36_22960 [Deltaproteobacteria bacterium]|nr:hypothetical protein [Deltaproteobacteria bacterium]
MKTVRVAVAVERVAGPVPPFDHVLMRRFVARQIDEDFLAGAEVAVSPLAARLGARPFSVNASNGAVQVVAIAVAVRAFGIGDRGIVVVIGSIVIGGERVIVIVASTTSTRDEERRPQGKCDDQDYRANQGGVPLSKTDARIYNVLASKKIGRAFARPIFIRSIPVD